MARRLSHIVWASVVGTIFVAATAQRCQAQVPPAPPPANQPAGDVKNAAKNPPPKDITKKQIDEVIEKVFGRDSQELRQPIRVWLPSFSMVVTAKEVGVLGGRTVRFHDASAAVADPDDFTSKATVFHGQEIVITFDGVLKQLTELKGNSVTSVDIHNKQTTITIRQGVKTETQEAKDELIKRQLSTGVAVPESASDPMNLGNGVTSAKKEPKSKFSTLGLQARFQFDLASNSPVTELLPAPPKTHRKPAAWNNEDLTKVPEASFGEPISKAQTEIKAMAQTAHVLTKINNLNRRRTDGFMLALLAERADLQGLPFLMGDQCRTREDDSKIFALVASLLHERLAMAKANVDADSFDDFWGPVASAFQAVNAAQRETRAALGNANLEQINRAMVAVLTQILMPEPEKARLGVAKFLATVPNVEATKALARLALYSPEESVRSAAIAGLKLRREKDYTDVLLQGFRYPLPAVSKRAAEALVELERNDLLSSVIDVLEQPDPRLPVMEKRDGKEVSVVRELVRINHHRNCMLCHAPGNTDNTPEGVLKAAVPLPNVPFPKPSEGGGYQDRAEELPDTVVRIDMTYLRQDFSLMMPVSDAHPWPDMQRFDFLVRTRVLTPEEAKTIEKSASAEEPGRQSPYHRAALYALRELTGRDTTPTAAAWRKLLAVRQ